MGDSSVTTYFLDLDWAPSSCQLLAVVEVIDKEGRDGVKVHQNAAQRVSSGYWSIKRIRSEDQEFRKSSVT